MHNGMEVYLEKSESLSQPSDMDLKSLRNLVKQGENGSLEFKLKATHPEKIVREIVAFANTNGGKLLIGVGDDKSIPGLKFVDEDEYVIVKALEKYCFPPISYDLERIRIIDEREVLVFTIPKSDEKPHFVRLENEDIGKAYVRVQDRSVQASKEIKQILRRENEEGVKFRYGDKEKVLMQYLSDNQKITVEIFAQVANLPRWVASRTLVLLVISNVLKVKPDEVVDWYSEI